MLNYTVYVNSNFEIIVLNYEDEKGIHAGGYEMDSCWDGFTTNVEEYMKDNKNAFKTEGIFKIYGYDNSINTPDGYFESYYVTKIEKLYDVKL